MKHRDLVIAGLSIVALAVVPAAARAQRGTVTVDPKADIKTNTDVKTDVKGNESGSASPRVDDRDHQQAKDRDRDKDRDKDDKMKGLDRADQAAGQHGAQGRENARDKQSR